MFTGEVEDLCSVRALILDMVMSSIHIPQQRGKNGKIFSELLILLSSLSYILLFFFNKEGKNLKKMMSVLLIFTFSSPQPHIFYPPLPLSRVKFAEYTPLKSIEKSNYPQFFFQRFVRIYFRVFKILFI